MALGPSPIPPLQAFLELTRGALQLDPDAFRTAEAIPGLALVVVLLAGLSIAFGQASVLFLNRVKPDRFFASLLVSAVHHAFTFGFWTLSIWLLGRSLFGGEEAVATVARAVGLGYAPQLFGFLVFMPYLGVPVFVLLSLWSLLAILVGVQVAMDFTPFQAVAVSSLGWLVLQLSKRTIGRPLVALARWSWRLIAGVEPTANRGELEAFAYAYSAELTTDPLEIIVDSLGEPREGPQTDA